MNKLLLTLLLLTSCTTVNVDLVEAEKFCKSNGGVKQIGRLSVLGGYGVQCNNGMIKRIDE